MLLKVFSIYDSKAEAFLQPFFSKTKGDAIRSLTDLVNDDKHNFCKYSEDFTLFECGTWDDGSSIFNLHTAPTSVISFLELKK